MKLRFLFLCLIAISRTFAQSEPPISTQYIETNGVTLHCKVAGSGKTIILLHGFPEFWYSWNKVIPLLSPHYKVVVPDMRGYNLSSKPSKIRDYRVDLLVEDIAGLIKSLGNEQVILIGHDWGGIVAWLTASKHPELIEKLVILNVPHPLEIKKQVFGGNLRQAGKSWYAFFFQTPFVPEFFLSRNPKNTFTHFLKGWSIDKSAFSDADIAEYAKVYPNRKAFKYPIHYYRSLIQHTFFQNNKKWQAIAAPTLVLWGEKDKALGKELTYRTQNYCTQKVKIEYLPNCSHWIQQEHPDWVAKHILAFCG